MGQLWTRSEEPVQEKWTQSTVIVQSIKITFILNFTDPLTISMILIFLSFREKAHDNKEFSCEN